ncbi:Uncharacterised protein [uncultured Clostridium sp.]|uniref:hypothetical protein n=1 Tax=uncultured Clostridium sp. TaxID=59620 RepID=UPI000820E913|nr:hypothetical protein [uncultured Clostridium sp.]SCI85422.1 Uncharacterised protein [uncultured Clostridium sp.]
MIRKKFLITYSILVLNFLVFIGCSEQNKTLNQVQLDESIQTDSQFDTKDKNITISSDIAKFISYNDKSIYIVDLKIFDEFSTSNEGRVRIDKADNTLIFDMIKSTGTVTGAISGPKVSFKLNLDTNEIVESDFLPAPDYEKLGKIEFIEHSNEVIELSNERIIEIGNYFEKFLNDIISNQ